MENSNSGPNERFPVKANPAQAAAPSAIPRQRRHDVDWLRTLAMGLLIIYHVFESFQHFPDGHLFLQNETALKGLGPFMALLNVWRIPIVFLISGMGVRFAMDRRDWKQLLKERTNRILLPFVFGYFTIAPLGTYIGMKFWGRPVEYFPGPLHLWFLGNIYLYVLVLLPLLAWLRNHPDNILVRLLTALSRRPLALMLLAVPLMIEAALTKPEFYILFVWTVHGFWLGMLCFFMGFMLVSTRDAFWPAAEKIRWVVVAVAISLYAVRMLRSGSWLGTGPKWLIALESMNWMLAVLGFASVYLNKPSRSLTYFSKAVYPVYIVHLPVQFAIAYFLFPLPLPAVLKLIVLMVGTFGVSIMLYEYVLRRLKWIRPLFGLKLHPT